MGEADAVDRENGGRSNGDSSESLLLAGLRSALCAPIAASAPQPLAIARSEKPVPRSVVHRPVDKSASRRSSRT